jgi:hypothetical protein
MLTVMPALTCDYLGERFFEDVCALKTVPSIRDSNVSDAFNALEKEGADRLKVCIRIKRKFVSNCLMSTFKKFFFRMLGNNMQKRKKPKVMRNKVKPTDFNVRSCCRYLNRQMIFDNSA